MLFMKKLTKIASGVLALGFLMATGVTTFAATDIPANTDTKSSNAAISEEATNRRSIKKDKTARGNMERPELTEDQKAEMTEHMKERMDEQLKDGNITQEQYDQALSKIEEGKRPMNLGHGNGRKARADRGQGGLCNIETPEVTD